VNLLTLVPLGLGALLGAFLAINAVDTGILAHGLLIGLFCAVGFIWVIKRGTDTGGTVDPAAGDMPYNDALVRAGVIASTFWGVVGFLVGLVIAALICSLIAWVAILFTGRHPRGLFDFVVGVSRWMLRVHAYALLLITDQYPSFSLE